MLTKDKKNLMVIANFFTDTSLPKHQVKTNSSLSRAVPMDSDDVDFGDQDSQPASPPQTSGVFGGILSRSGGGFFDDGWRTNAGGVIRHRPEDEGYWDGISIRVKNEFTRQFVTDNYEFLIGRRKMVTRNPLKKLLWWLTKLGYRKYVLVKSKGTVEQFFINVKQSPQELSKSDKKLESYLAYLQKSKESGQVALQEKIKTSIYQTGREAIMYSIDLTKYFKEEQIVEFVLKTEKGLRMDWIKNFTRHIPDEVLAVKKRCDELEIFDNYCILHYDPDNKAVELTEKEKERKKDPVLFGLLRGSSNLYFVGDWIDEYCDLTFDKIVETINKNEEITDNYQP